MKEESIACLSTDNIKDELKKRKLSDRGPRQALVKRLKKVFKEERIISESSEIQALQLASSPNQQDIECEPDIADDEHSSSGIKPSDVKEEILSEEEEDGPPETIYYPVDMIKTELNEDSDEDCLQEMLLESEYDVELKPHSCPHCSFRARAQSLLKRHIGAVHNGERPFACHLCAFSSSASTDLQRHVSTVHLNEKPFQCCYCDFRCARKPYLNDHINCMHTKAIIYHCTNAGCDFNSTRRRDISRHEASVHNCERKHACSDCNYRASFKADLDRHILTIHKKEKPYSCPHCTYSNSQKTNLKNHIETIHLGIKPFHCSYINCDYKSAKNCDLNRHISAVHKNERPFQCPECEYSATKKHDLKRHYDARHNGIRPQQCPYCSYNARSKTHINSHIARMHKDKESNDITNEYNDERGTNCDKEIETNSEINTKEESIDNYD